MRGRRTRRPTASFSVRSTNNAAAGSEDRADEAPPGKADFVLVLKAPRRLLLLRGGRVVRDYQVALGKNPEGPKRHYLDERTPEGRYTIDGRIADSSFHRALHISYPNERDRELARGAGVAPGDGVMIHGLPNGERWVGKAHRNYDWTNGCIAVTDDEMDEIWELVDDGTPIEIRP
jgi:murein L,D-transpeptidase YafK